MNSEYLSNILTYKVSSIIRLIAFRAEYTDGMLKLEDHNRLAWLPEENLLRYDMTEAYYSIRDVLVRLFLNLE